MLSIRPDADSGLYRLLGARRSYKQLVNAPTDADAWPVSPRFFSRKQARRSLLLSPFSSAQLARYCCAVNTHVLLFSFRL
jgi:hypothetical protein